MAIKFELSLVITFLAFYDCVRTLFILCQGTQFHMFQVMHASDVNIYFKILLNCILKIIC